jgi:HK97 family phage prohead protease
MESPTDIESTVQRRAFRLDDTDTVEVDDDGRRVYTALAYQYEPAVDRHQTTMARGAMSHVTVDDFRILEFHRSDSAPVGKPVSITDTPEGPVVKFVFADTDRARDMESLVAGGFLRAVSVGFFPDPAYTTVRSDGVTVFGKADLVELSLVNVPSSKGALIQLARDLDTPEADLADLLADLLPVEETAADDSALVVASETVECSDSADVPVATLKECDVKGDADITDDITADTPVEVDELAAAVDTLRGLGVDDSILALISPATDTAVDEETAAVDVDAEARARMLRCLAALRYRR